MATGVLSRPSVEVSREALPEWQEALRRLLDDVRAWSEAQGWHVEAQTITVLEDQIGSYEAERLLITGAPYALYVEPVGRIVMGAEGRVDLYAYPSMDRVLLLRRGERWIVTPEMGPTWPLAWGPETYVDLVERLTTGP